MEPPPTVAAETTTNESDSIYSVSQAMSPFPTQTTPGSLLQQQRETTMKLQQQQLQALMAKTGAPQSFRSGVPIQSQRQVVLKHNSMMMKQQRQQQQQQTYNVILQQSLQREQIQKSLQAQLEQQKSQREQLLQQKMLQDARQRKLQEEAGSAKAKVLKKGAAKAQQKAPVVVPSWRKVRSAIIVNSTFSCVVETFVLHCVSLF